MGRILVIQHETQPAHCEAFSLQMLIERWQDAGHKVLVASGIDDLPDADLAILHVDLSVVPQSYADAAERYPRSVNASALDIRKRTVSRNLLSRTDDWDGRVIIKTDLNCGGLPEQRAKLRAKEKGEFIEAPEALVDYPIVRHLSSVIDEVWAKEHFVVERFLPERGENGGFYLRTWVFFGEQDRCRRFFGHEGMIKGTSYLTFEDADVPEFIRAERERLGIDYGKLDFVIHKGEPVLLDANKTMGMPPDWMPDLRAAYADLAPGLDAMLSQ
jgi:hypothetical protein